MSNVQSVIFSFHHLRDCPDAAQRKKIKKILKEGMKARLARQCGRAGQSSAAAQASAQTSDKVNDNADSICWFCHADVTNLANNKCAGCRKVRTHLGAVNKSTVYWRGSLSTFLKVDSHCLYF